MNSWSQKIRRPGCDHPGRSRARSARRRATLDRLGTVRTQRRLAPRTRPPVVPGLEHRQLSDPTPALPVGQREFQAEVALDLPQLAPGAVYLVDVAVPGAKRSHRTEAKPASSTRFVESDASARPNATVRTEALHLGRRLRPRRRDAVRGGHEAADRVTAAATSRPGTPPPGSGNSAGAWPRAARGRPGRAGDGTGGQAASSRSRYAIRTSSWPGTACRRRGLPPGSRRPPRGCFCRRSRSPGRRTRR